MYSRGRFSARTNREVQGPRAASSFSRSPAERPSEKAWVCEMFTAMVEGFRSSTSLRRSAHCPSPHSSRPSTSGSR